jgi:hypothetical protein
LGEDEDFSWRPPTDISLYICRDVAGDLRTIDEDGPLWLRPKYYTILFYSSVVIRWARWRRALPIEAVTPPPQDEVARRKKQIVALLRLMHLKQKISGR